MRWTAKPLICFWLSYVVFLSKENGYGHCPATLRTAVTEDIFAVTTKTTQIIADRVSLISARIAYTSTYRTKIVRVEKQLIWLPGANAPDVYI